MTGASPLRLVRWTKLLRPVKQRIAHPVHLERLYHSQNHDCNHQNRGDFVTDPKKSFRMPISVLREGFSPSCHKSMQYRQSHETGDLGMQPSHAPSRVAQVPN